MPLASTPLHTCVRNAASEASFAFRSAKARIFPYTDAMYCKSPRSPFKVSCENLQVLVRRLLSDEGLPV